MQVHSCEQQGRPDVETAVCVRYKPSQSVRNEGVVRSVRRAKVGRPGSNSIVCLVQRTAKRLKATGGHGNSVGNAVIQRRRGCRSIKRPAARCQQKSGATMYTVRRSSSEDARLICELWDGFTAAGRGNQLTQLVGTLRAGREA